MEGIRFSNFFFIFKIYEDPGREYWNAENIRQRKEVVLAHILNS